MTCREITGNVHTRSNVDRNRYRWLHEDGKKLIKSWFDRAWKKRNCRDRNSFEPYIYAWIALNGWASCVTDLDRDMAWKVALMEDDGICDDFSRLIRDPHSSVSKYARQLYDLWPIFKAQEIRRQGVRDWNAKTRRLVVAHYLSRGVQRYEPQCWGRHRAEASEVPLDWPHTLAVLYRVRCNLFHGEKSPHSEMDAKIVGKSFKVLVNLLDEAGYLS